MKRSTRLGVIAIAAIAAGVGGFFFARWQSAPPSRQALLQQAARLESRQRAPDFALPDLDGKLHAFNQWRGQLRLVNFWATWCGPCRKEIPELVALQARFGERGLQVIGISTDEPNASVVKDFAKKYKINYPLLLDNGHAANIALHLGFQLIGLPASVLIGPDNRILGYHLGPIEADRMQNKIEKLLNGGKKSINVGDQP